MTWPARLHAANAVHTGRLERLLGLEFKRLAGAIDPAKLEIRKHDAVLRAHQERVAIILASEKRAAAATFGFMALEMIEAPAAEAKAEPPKPTPTRAERIAQVLRALARMVGEGAVAVAAAELLARDRAVVAQVELLILAQPQATPAVLAATALERPRVAAALARAQALASGVEAELGQLAEAATGEAGAIGQSRNEPAPNLTARQPRLPFRRDESGRAKPPGGGATPPPGGPSDPPRRRSRFSLLVERLVREEAPVRARRIAVTSGRVIGSVLGEAAANGWGQDKTARRLRDVLGGPVTLNRARVIARTELGSAQNGAGLAMALDREAAGETDLVKAWTSIDDERRRPTHRDADGQERALSEPFRVGDSLLQHPGDPDGALREIISCFPGDTPVVPLGRVRKIFRRTYNGPMVTVETKAAQRITGTPNHPVLTSHGWVALGDLQRGDNLVCHQFKPRLIAAEYEPQCQPMTIAEAFELGAQIAPPERATGGWDDFHGDGRAGEIEIVLLERELAFHDNAARAVRIAQLEFAKANVRLAGVTGPRALLGRIYAAHRAANGVVCGVGPRLPRFGRHLSHADEVGVALSARFDPSLEQETTDNATGDAALLGEREFAHAGQIVFGDQVATVSVEEWSGHVFNLETETNAYVAGFAIAGNCRCSMLFYRRTAQP